jgi:hypothetical protein
LRFDDRSCKETLSSENIFVQELDDNVLDIRDIDLINNKKKGEERDPLIL